MSADITEYQTGVLRGLESGRTSEDPDWQQAVQVLLSRGLIYLVRAPRLLRSGRSVPAPPSCRLTESGRFFLSQRGDAT